MPYISQLARVRRRLTDVAVVIVLAGMLVLIVAMSASSQAPTPAAPRVIEGPPPVSTAEPTIFGLEVKWVIANGGMLLLTGGMYRLLRETQQQAKADHVAFQVEREAWREESRKDREEMKAILRDAAAANHAHASNLQINTKATERLAQEVRLLSDRQERRG